MRSFISNLPLIFSFLLLPAVRGREQVLQRMATHDSSSILDTRPFMDERSSVAPSQRCSKAGLCEFACTDGYQLEFIEVNGGTAGTCACTPPDVVCNGKCGPFPDGCPAATPTQDKIFRSFRRVRALSPSSLPSDRSSPAFQKNADTPTCSAFTEQTQQAQDAGCAAHETLCGAYAPRGRRLMECIDTQRSLESCGGCLHPLHATFDQSSMKRQGSIGVDCTALEGVEDVRCSAGRCVVLTCESGWTVAPSGDHCIPNRPENAASPKNGTPQPYYIPNKMPQVIPSPATATTSSPIDTQTSTSTTSGQFRGASATTPTSSATASGSSSSSPDGPDTGGSTTDGMDSSTASNTSSSSPDSMDADDNTTDSTDPNTASNTSSSSSDSTGADDGSTSHTGPAATSDASPSSPGSSGSDDTASDDTDGNPALRVGFTGFAARPRPNPNHSSGSSVPGNGDTDSWKCKRDAETGVCLGLDASGTPGGNPSLKAGFRGPAARPLPNPDHSSGSSALPNGDTDSWNCKRDVETGVCLGLNASGTSGVNPSLRVGFNGFAADAQPNPGDSSGSSTPPNGDTDSWNCKRDAETGGCLRLDASGTPGGNSSLKAGFIGFAAGPLPNPGDSSESSALPNDNTDPSNCKRDAETGVCLGLDASGTLGRNPSLRVAFTSFAATHPPNPGHSSGSSTPPNGDTDSWNCKRDAETGGCLRLDASGTPGENSSLRAGFTGLAAVPLPNPGDSSGSSAPPDGSTVSWNCKRDVETGVCLGLDASGTPGENSSPRVGLNGFVAGSLLNPGNSSGSSALPSGNTDSSNCNIDAETGLCADLAASGTPGRNPSLRVAFTSFAAAHPPKPGHSSGSSTLPDGSTDSSDCDMDAEPGVCLGLDASGTSGGSPSVRLGFTGFAAGAPSNPGDSSGTSTGGQAAPLLGLVGAVSGNVAASVPDGRPNGLTQGLNRLMSSASDTADNLPSNVGSFVSADGVNSGPDLTSDNGLGGTTPTATEPSSAPSSVTSEAASAGTSSGSPALPDSNSDSANCKRDAESGICLGSGTPSGNPLAGLGFTGFAAGAPPKPGDSSGSSTGGQAVPLLGLVGAVSGNVAASVPDGSPNDLMQGFNRFVSSVSDTGDNPSSNVGSSVSADGTTSDPDLTSGSGSGDSAPSATMPSIAPSSVTSLAASAATSSGSSALPDGSTNSSNCKRDAETDICLGSDVSGTPGGNPSLSVGSIAYAAGAPPNSGDSSGSSTGGQTAPLPGSVADVAASLPDGSPNDLKQGFNRFKSFVFDTSDNLPSNVGSSVSADGSHGTTSDPDGPDLPSGNGSGDSKPSATTPSIAPSSPTSEAASAATSSISDTANNACSDIQDTDMPGENVDVSGAAHAINHDVCFGLKAAASG